jgi:hypothetical protein
VLSPALSKRTIRLAVPLAREAEPRNLSVREQFSSPDWAGLQSSLFPPGWLAPADIGKNPARRGFCFSAADSAIFPVEDEWHVSHPPP